MMGMTREEAIKFLELDKEQRGKCFISDAIDVAIKALDQKPRTGHWIKSEIKNATHCVCSECGDYWDITGDLFAFCPNCGADMRGVEE